MLPSLAQPAVGHDRGLHYGEGARAFPLPEGTTQGLCLLPSQPHHGWRALRPLRPPQRFQHGHRHRDRTPVPWPNTGLPFKGGPLFGRINEHELAPSNSTPSTWQRSDDSYSLASKPPSWPSRRGLRSVNPHSRWRGSY
jgi:hypothetical protein